MATKGYGITIDEIDWSSPVDLEPYAKAHNLETQEKDSMAYVFCGNYVLSAVSVAVERCLAGKKARLKYIDNPVLKDAFEYEGLTDDEIYEREIKKALFAEEAWINAGKMKGLPETVI